MVPPTSEALLAQQLSAFRAALQGDEAAAPLDPSPDAAEAAAEEAAANAAAAAAAAAAVAARELEGL